MNGNSPTTDKLEKPFGEGVIGEIETERIRPHIKIGTILVEGIFEEKATLFYFGVDTNTELVGIQGESIGFSDLREGQGVQVWHDSKYGMTDDDPPGARAKKIVVVSPDQVDHQIFNEEQILEEDANAKQNEHLNDYLIEVEIVNPVTGETVQALLFPEEYEAYMASMERSKIEEDCEMIKSFGTIPEFAAGEEKNNWINETLMALSRKVKIDRNLMYPKGPIIGHGVSYKGTLFVEIKRGETPDEKFFNTIYQKFDKEASRLGITDIPLVFRYGDIPESD